MRNQLQAVSPCDPDRIPIGHWPLAPQVHLRTQRLLPPRGPFVNVPIGGAEGREDERGWGVTCVKIGKAVVCFPTRRLGALRHGRLTIRAFFGVCGLTFETPDERAFYEPSYDEGKPARRFWKRLAILEKKAARKAEEARA